MLKFVLFALVLFTELSSRETVCLNMIVKNEQDVIERCLTKAKPLIDYWVIVDTGSTDKTIELIKNTLKDIPGELHERKWVDFEHNRNEALDLAKGKSDYILFIDADETFEYQNDFKWPVLDRDFYYITTEFGGTIYFRNQLIKSSLDWKWMGVLHEVVVSSQAKTFGKIAGLVDFVRTDGARSKDPLKYQKDAELMERALLKNPKDTRTQFYLAQSYKDAGNYEKAKEAYLKRIALGGWEEEIFWSKYQLGLMGEGDNFYLKEAYFYRPSRIEPLYYLSLKERLNGNMDQAYEWSKQGAFTQLSQDVLFVEKWIYDWGLLFEYSIASYWVQKYEESYLASHLLLSRSELPENVREQIKKNLVWISQKINDHNIKKRDVLAVK